MRRWQNAAGMTMLLGHLMVTWLGKSGEKWNKFGYSSPNHKQFVTAPERSGLYYFHLHGESGQFFSFPWVVAPKKPQAKLAVLLSNLTWNAYNRPYR
jgi:hypothetical protein